MATKIALALLLVTVVSGANIPYGIVPECAGKMAGSKIYVGSDCTSYAICQPAGLSFIETCQAGLVYNLQKDMCDWPANVPHCTGGSMPQEQNTNQWNQQQYYPQEQQYPQEPQYYYPQQQNYYPEQQYYYPQQYPQKYWMKYMIGRLMFQDAFTFVVGQTDFCLMVDNNMGQLCVERQCSGERNLYKQGCELSFGNFLVIHLVIAFFI